MSGRLRDVLARELAAIEVYADLLEGEATALSTGDFAGLPALAERKSELAREISVLGQERDTEQQALGFASGRTGADAACAAAGAQTLQAWHAVLESAALAHDRNHRNGVMIHTHLDFTRKTINFLQAGGQPLYGPDGSHKAGAGSGHSLARG